MIPLRDNIRPRIFPWVNYLVIGASSLAFLLQLAQDPAEPNLIEQYGMVPARLTSPGEPVYLEQPEPVQTPLGVVVRMRREELAPPAVPVPLTLLTCIFLHGGWLHFLGNMWFLHIFGDNVEDRFGHFGFAGLYLGTGVAASIAHALAAPGSPVPTIGASGAIAGVMGAYLLLYPRAVVLTLVPIFFLPYILALPAPIFLGVWFLLQFFQGVMTIGGEMATGVAWWAHIGGFVVGAVVAGLVGKSGWGRPPAKPREGDPDHPGWGPRYRPGARWR